MPDIKPTSPEAIRNQLSPSQKVILSVARRHQSITQPAIVKETGLSQQSVSRLANMLLDVGAVFEGQRSSKGRRGQPSMPIEIAPGFCYSFGVAMMTDALSISLMDFSGVVLEQAYRNISVMTRQTVIEVLQEAFVQFLKKRRINKDRVIGVGVGISGYSLGGRGLFNTPRSLDDWALVDIGDVLSEALALPVCVENDGNAAALGEAIFGVGRNYADLAYLYIALGIGGGIISRRKLLRGKHGNGGEMGLLLPPGVYPEPNLALLRQIHIQHGGEADDISDLLEKLDAESPAVDEWIGRIKDSLSLIVSSLAAILDTEAIVIGGRIPKPLAQKIIPHIEIYDDVRRTQPRPLPLLLASDADGDACSIGAASLAFEQFFFDPESE